MNFGYITNGKVYLSLDGKGSAEVQSEFAQQVVRRHQKAVEKSQWKSSRNGSDGSDIWNQGGALPVNAQVRLQSVAVVPDGHKLFYTLRTESVGGLFCYDYKEKEERRVFHKEGVDIYDLSLNVDGTKMLCSAGDGQGRSVALLSTERYKVDFITEGDAHDVAPSWVPGEEAFVFQSSGLGRSQSGEVVQVANATIQKIHLSEGRHETLLEDSRYDFLSPRIDADGNLYCIRRPYLEHGRHLSHLDTLKDFLLMPFRLLKAVFGFLDMMTRVFGKQKLSNAATGEAKEVDMKEAYIKGAYLNLSKINRDEADASAIPSEWELIKVRPDGSVDVLHRKVMDFEISSSGEIIYTNGFVVRSADRESTSGKTLYKGKEIIERVFAL